VSLGVRESVGACIILAPIFLVLLYGLRALRLAREGVCRLLGNLFAAVLTFATVPYILVSARLHVGTPEQNRIMAAILAAVLFLYMQRRRRSRHIPRTVRQAVIARDLKGKRFNPDKHQIDHVWPLSRGGSNTKDNLRVVDKGQNLRKGARLPRFWEMW
jgi:uncharacterized membrane protein